MSHDEGASADPSIAQIGATVRAMRKRLDLSVHALAQRSGVSFGLLSQLERGLGNPSLQAIQRVAVAIGVPLPQLLEASTADFTVVRGDRPHTLAAVEDAAAGADSRRELLSPPGESLLQLIRTTLPPGFSNEGRPYRHIGTETVTVLSGALTISHGETRAVLHEGDTATYTTSTPHWWANESDGTTVVLGAVTPFER